MNCCGEDRPTPFCPMCGKSMEGDLCGLLKHVQQRIRNGRYSIKRWTEANPAQARIPREKVLLEKWVLWRDALIEKMQDSKQ